MRILLIDDSRTMRNIARAVLAQLGHYDVDEACDGREGLARSIFTRPDLVIVDGKMPVMDGFAFVRAFREQNPATPVIPLVAQEDEFDLDQPPWGIQAVAVKPFTPAHLRSKIESCLPPADLQAAA